MKNKNGLFGFFFLSLFTACNPTFQYDVYVQNATEEEIRVDFDTKFLQNGEKEGSIYLAKGEQKRIISTPDFSVKGNWRTTANHCSHVAKYVNAYRKDKKESKVLWCRNSPAIKFAVVDIGQGEFTIEYKSSDF